MAQFNINLTPEFEKDLETLMKKRGIETKSEAIRNAVHEAVEKLKKRKKEIDFESWLGWGLRVSPNSNPRFKSDKDLWE